MTTGRKPPKLAEIRWTFDGAAREFNVSRATLVRKLIASGWVKSGNGEKPTLLLTADIIKALYRDEGRERYELSKARAEMLKMENAAALADLIPITEIKRLNQAVYEAIAGEINSWRELGEKQKQNLVKNLRTLKT